MSETSHTVALLTTFTSEAIARELRATLEREAWGANVYTCGYQQSHQDILDAGSGLYKSHPVVVILFHDVRFALGDLLFHPYAASEEERRAWAKQTLQELCSLVETMKTRLSAKMIVHNFEVPWNSPLGILEEKQPFGLKRMVQYVNDGLRNTFQEDPQVFVFDYDEFCARLGKERAFDDKMYYLGDMKLPFHVASELCRAYLPFLNGVFGRVRKCLVLDLDNTLWGGVIGEDGLSGIRLGPTPEGRPFLELQKYILALFDRGVVLAVNSKNNEEDALRVFREHPEMILKEEHFAAMRMNWNDKASNMASLAEELNLGLESFVFLDDDPMNRDLVRSVYPEVLVVDLPKDPADYLRMVMDLRVFDTLALTAEDRERGKMYAAERHRRDFQAHATNIEDFLVGLNIEVVIEPANEQTIPRIAQLTQKTNQFNLTTRRYQEEDIRHFAASDAWRVVSLHAKDRFGDHGVVGVAMMERREDDWRIDTFLLSCRVIGRGIEQSLLGFLVEHARQLGAKRLLGEFVPSEKNAPAKDLYEKSGFVRLEERGGVQTWVFHLSHAFSPPKHLRVTCSL